MAAYYYRLVDEYGHDPRAVDASSRATVDVCNAVPCELVDMSGKTVLEVGCGFGHLGAFIRERQEGGLVPTASTSPPGRWRRGAV